MKHTNLFPIYRIFIQNSAVNTLGVFI